MADGLNRVTLLGNLGADPELRYTGGGQAVMRLRLATTASYLDKNKVRQEITEWHEIQVWGKRAEALVKFLRKGARIYVEGSLRTSSWEDKDGVKRWRTNVQATQLLLCEKKPDDREELPTHDPKTGELPPDDGPPMGPPGDDIPF